MYRIISETDAGLLRDNNQDCLATGAFDEHALWAVVCDGMGGPSGGRMASETAVEIIVKHLTSHYRSDRGPNFNRDLLFSAISAANAMIFDMAQNDEDLKGMGTTVVAVIVEEDLACIAHAGDSRAYQISGDGMQQITKDHSVVQFLVEKGEITPEEAKSHPNKNFITRAVGVAQDIDIDYNEVTLTGEDYVLICTDGLTGCVSDEEIETLVRDGDPETRGRRLIEKANACGGPDNISVVIISQ